MCKQIKLLKFCIYLFARYVKQSNCSRPMEALSGSPQDKRLPHFRAATEEEALLRHGSEPHNRNSLPPNPTSSTLPRSQNTILHKTQNRYTAITSHARKESKREDEQEIGIWQGKGVLLQRINKTSDRRLEGDTNRMRSRKGNNKKPVFIDNFRQFCLRLSPPSPRLVNPIVFF